MSEDFIIINRQEIIVKTFPEGDGEFGCTLVDDQSLVSLPIADVRETLKPQYISLTDD